MLSRVHRSLGEHPPAARFVCGQRRERGGNWSGGNGFTLALVLFLCLAGAVVIQTVVAATVLTQEAVRAEAVGRDTVAEQDQGLAFLRGDGLKSWNPSAWTALDWVGVQHGGTATAPSEPQGELSRVGTSGWVMRGSFREDSGACPIATSAWLERGRDGLDLPLAAVVARRVITSPGRATEWVASEDRGAGGSVGVYSVGPFGGAPLGEGCLAQPLAQAWSLDAGWRQFLQRPERATTGSQSIGAEAGGEGVGSGVVGASVVCGPRVVVVQGLPGQVVNLAGSLAAEARPTSGDSPLLVVATRGADLDARGLGDFYGVIVVDEGSVWMDATTLHGALIVSETADMGGSGKVVFSRPILRWAIDRSLGRARLVPGTRREEVTE